MDLMKLLRGRTANSSQAQTPRSQSSTPSSLHAGRTLGHGPSAGHSGQPPHVPPPHHHPPGIQGNHDPLTSPSPHVNNNHIFPWRFTSGVLHGSRSRRQLRPNRQTYTGISAEKSVCEKYPEIWEDWQGSKCHTATVLVSSDGVEFPIHHVILAGASPFFKSLFASRRPEQGNREVVDMDSDMVTTILKFMYTGECEISEVNVESLLAVAHRFQVVGIIQLCSKFISRSMTPDNCLRLYNLTKPLACSELCRAGKLYLLQNFKHVLVQEEFLNLDFEELEPLLRDDFLNVRTEEMTFNAIRAWVEHAPAERADKVVDLLQCIRFGLLNVNFFSSVVLPWKYIANSQEVQESLFQAQVFLASMASQNPPDFDLNDPLARPRVPNEIIFAIGGWSAGSPTSFMETYDARADRWFLSQGSDIAPRAYHGLVTIGHKIYMIGGFDGNEHFNTMRSFDPMTRIWTEKANMHFPRCYISCCVLDGMIYALGGFNGRIRMNSVERYDPPRNQWEVLPSMVRQRSDASACALLGRVYIAGGFNGQEVLNSVEVFDPVENQWSFIRPMRSPRSGVVIAAHKDKLYAIGGFNGFTRLSTNERYDPKVGGEWDVIADMSSPRSNFAAAVVDDLIFVIGGFNGTTTIPYVEAYDSLQNTWIDANHMNLNRSALAACVLRGLPNGRDYTYLSRVQEILGLDTSAQDEEAMDTFRMLPRNTFLDFTTATAVIKELAKFHASSFIHWNGNGSEILSEFPILAESQWLPASEFSPLLAKFISNTFPGIADLLDRNGFVDEGQLVQKFFGVDQVIERMAVMTRVGHKFPSVVNHGDLWTNNILFKYNSKGLIDELKFVDFQASKVGSRILDLSYLLFTSVRNDVLNRHELELLRLYFDVFQEASLAGIPANQGAPLTFQGQPLGWEEFTAEWKEYKVYGLTLAILYAPPMFAALENIPDMETLSMRDIEGPREKESGFSDFLESPTTLSRVLNLVKHHLPRSSE